MVWVRERLGAERVSERRACQVLGQARSTQRRERHIPDDEARLVAEMVELATHYGRYGYRRITAMLRWEGWKVNHKRVERLWRQEGLKVPSRQPKRRRLWLHDGSCVRLRAAHKDHVWSYDFVHERTHDGRAFRLLTLLDEYTRECLAIEVQRQMNHQDVLDRLAELFVDRGVPEYIRSDNGSVRRFGIVYFRSSHVGFGGRRCSAGTDSGCFVKDKVGRNHGLSQSMHMEGGPEADNGIARNSGDDSFPIRVVARAFVFSQGCSYALAV